MPRAEGVTEHRCDAAGGGDPRSLRVAAAAIAVVMLSVLDTPTQFLSRRGAGSVRRNKPRQATRTLTPRWVLVLTLSTSDSSVRRCAMSRPPEPGSSDIETTLGCITEYI